MAYTDINSEDRLVQATFAEHLEQQLGQAVRTVTPMAGRLSDVVAGLDQCRQRQHEQAA